MASRKLADHYAKAAKTAGYAARSAFKLLEMHEKFQVVKGTVLDLGCHPGAWLQVVSKLQPPDSFALGVDLSATDLSGLKHVDVKRTFTVQSDVFELCEQSVAALRHTALPCSAVHYTVNILYDVIEFVIQNVLLHRLCAV